MIVSTEQERASLADEYTQLYVLAQTVRPHCEVAHVLRQHRPRAAGGGGMRDATRTCMLMPPVSRYMTRNPHSVARRDLLSSARDLMSEHKIRHLPVLDGREFVGLVTDRDLLAIHTPEDRVADAMSSDVAAVSEATPLDEVIALIDSKRLDSVIIVGDGGIQGIFTQTDAMRAFCDVLRREEEGER